MRLCALPFCKCNNQNTCTCSVNMAPAGINTFCKILGITKTGHSFIQNANPQTTINEQKREKSMKNNPRKRHSLIINTLISCQGRKCSLHVKSSNSHKLRFITLYHNVAYVTGCGRYWCRVLLSCKLGM